MLRDHLLADDWDGAGHRYAAELDRSYGAVHRIEDSLGHRAGECGQQRAPATDPEQR